jgi:hypothetical protein
MTRAALRLAPAGLSWALVCLGAGEAHANDSPPLSPPRNDLTPASTAADVVLRVDPELQNVATRVAAELSSLGFQVVLSDPSEEPLEEATRRGRALAGVSVTEDGAGVSLTVFDRVTSKWTRRTLPRHSRNSEEVIALGAAELLRVSLLELARPEPPQGEVEPPERVRQLVKETAITPSAATFALGVRGSWEAARGFSPVPGAEVALRTRVGGFELGLLGMQQLTVQEARAATGRFELLARRGLVTLGGRVIDEPTWQVAPQIGFGVTHLRATGYPLAGAPTPGAPSPAIQSVGRSDSVLLPSAEVTVEMRRHLFGGAWLTLSPTFGVTPRRTALTAYDQEAASWGPTWWRGSAGMEVHW